MRKSQAVQFVFEDAIRSDRFVTLARLRSPRLDLHLALGPCPDERLLPILPEDEARASLPNDLVVHDVHRIGGDRA